MKDQINGLHRTANPSYPILAVHSASSFSLVPGSGTEALYAQTSEKTTTEVLASQIIFSSPEHTRCLVLDITGHWTLVAIENGKAEKQKEGRLFGEGDKRVLRFASISKDGVITATGMSLPSIFGIHGIELTVRFKQPDHLETYQRRGLLFFPYTPSPHAYPCIIIPSNIR